MQIYPRTIEQIVEDQARRWALERSEPRAGAEARRRRVITLSRQHGAGGSAVGLRLCQALGLDFFDRDLIRQIAESAHLSERLVQALDEKDREALTDWLLAVASPERLSAAGYHDHLTRVIGTIARHGDAVILGRGAHLILGPTQALRILLVAPLETRIAVVMQREGLSEPDARRRIASVEADRSAFLRRHFRADFADPAQFDLIVNTGILGVEGAVASIQGALACLPSDRPQA